MVTRKVRQLLYSDALTQYVKMFWYDAHSCSYSAAI
jgi:hypothetical protein